MAVIISDDSYSYKRRNGAFPSAWAAMRPWAISESGKRAGKGIGYIVPTAYTITNKSYAGQYPNSATANNIGAWVGNGFGGDNVYQGAAVGTMTGAAYDKPFIICVTFDKFGNIPTTNITQWRECGLNVNPTEGQSFGYTNRVIIPAAMRDYVYITGIYIYDNSNDGNYSATNPRTQLTNYDVFVPVDITECKLFRDNQTYLNSNKGGLLITLSRTMTPYTTTGGAVLDNFAFRNRFNIMTPVMSSLGAPISTGITVVGLDSNQIVKACATLYPSKGDLLKDLWAWGAPYTTDLNSALYDNSADLVDNTPDGVPDNPTGGGDGTGDNMSDPIDFPSTPFSPASLGGYLTLVQSPSELEGLTSVLWKPVIRDLTDALKVYFNTDNLTNSVLSIMFYPVDLATMSLGLTHSDNIRIAWSTDNISADIMANNVSHEIDAGSYQTEEYYGSFLDYAPYTTADIWLPYIGYKPLDIDAVMSKTISVKYYVDFIDGLATAVIFADGQPINTYTGQLGIDLAVTGRDNAAKLRQTVDSVMTAVTGVNKAVGGVMQGAAQAAAGNAGGAVGAVTGLPQAAAGVGVAALQTALQQPSTVIYGTAGGENWLSMPQKCHIKFTRTVAASPASYIDELGYPTTYTASVSKFTGYLHCAAVFGDFTGIPAEDADEIQTLLQAGVHITEGVFG